MSQNDFKVPEGFTELPEGLGFTDVLRPVYRREPDAKRGLCLAMKVQANHGNMIGICHGGVLMTLADIAAAQAVNFARQKIAGSPTISLTFDFVSAAKEGDWIEAESERVELKRVFAFASGVIRCGDKVVLRYSGNIYTPDHQGFDGQIENIALLHGRGNN
jgi:uncharacterized protein (TIGR00369 family)